MSVFAFFVGIDWGSESHQVCVLDAERNRLFEGSVEHSGEALLELSEKLLALVDGDPTRLAVAIETPRGPVVETLLEKGLAVFAINPKQLDRFRDRHTVAGAKDDRRDALVLADSVRTDRDAFRQVRLGDQSSSSYASCRACKTSSRRSATLWAIACATSFSAISHRFCS